MELTITTDIVVAYSQCPRKAYLLLFSPDKGEPHEYVQILEQQRRAHQERYIDHLKQTHADVQPYSLENLRKGSAVLINAHLQVDGFAAHCGVLTRVEGTSTFGKYSYEPTIFVGTHSISKEQHLELSFVGYVLELGFYQFTRPFVVVTPFSGGFLAFFDSFLVRLPGGQVPQNAMHGYPDSLPTGPPTARAGDPTGLSPAVRRPPRSLSTATRRAKPN